MLKKDSDKNVLIKNTIMQYLMVIAQYVFPLITFPYLTRVLEPEAYGIHTYMTAVVLYFQLFVDFGFILSSTEQISKNRNNANTIQRIVSDTVFAKAILFIISLLILTILIPFQAILRSNSIISYLYMGTVFFSIFTADYLFRGIEKMEVLTYRFIASKFVSTCMVFIFVKHSSDLFMVPILNAAGSFVAVIITWFYIVKTLKIKLIRTSIESAFNQIKLSTVYFVSNIATTAFGAFTTIVMGFVLTPTQISFWGTSYNLITTVQSLYSPIVNSLFPHMVDKKDSSLIKQIFIIFLPMVVFGCMICLIGAKLIISIMCGQEYLSAVPVFRLLIPVLLFSFPAMVLGFPLLGAFGYTKEVTTCTVIAAVYHIIGISVLFLMRNLTIEYVAILRSSTELLLLATRVYYCKRKGLIVFKPKTA